MKSLIYVILITLPFIVSCNKITAPTEEPVYPKGSYTIEGTMYHLDIEGGCWQFVSNDNIGYELIGERASQIQIDSLHARLVVLNNIKVRSVCMVGKIVDLIDILSVW